jgi:hypothetical protein
MAYRGRATLVSSGNEIRDSGGFHTGSRWIGPGQQEAYE